MGVPVALSFAYRSNWKSVIFVADLSASVNSLPAVMRACVSFGAYVFVNWMASDWTPSHVVLAVMRRVNVSKSSATVTVRTHVRLS